MLQWMGGSRRKVATSRKSTYKRQKQYFEQRKQNTAAAGSPYDGKQQSRSLDILSLVNVPAVTVPTLVHEATDDSENDDDDYTDVDHRDSRTPPAVNAYESLPVYQHQQNSLSNCPDNEYSKNVSARLRDETLDGRENKLGGMKLTTAHEISVMDLLGESGPNDDAEEKNEPEAHVAFSVEGLGKVEVETPVHSPKRPVRYLSNGSSRRQAMRTLFPSQHLNNGLDDAAPLEDVMLEDVDLSPHDSIMEPFFSSRDIMSIGGPNNFFNTRNSSLFNWTSCELPGAGSSDELFSGIRDDETWNGRKFLEDNSDYLGEHKKTSMEQRDFGSDEYFDSKEQWMEDFTHGCWNLLSKRSSPKKTRTIRMKENFFPYTKNQVPNEFPDFRVTRKSGYSTTGMDKDDMRDTIYRFVDDTRDSSSLLSEESSSSTAVKGCAMKKS